MFAQHCLQVARVGPTTGPPSHQQLHLHVETREVPTTNSGLCDATCTHAHAHTHTGRLGQVRAHTHGTLRPSGHTHTRTHTHGHGHTHTDTDTHTDTHTHGHTHTHTDTHTGRLGRVRCYGGKRLGNRAPPPQRAVRILAQPKLPGDHQQRGPFPSPLESAAKKGSSSSAAGPPIRPRSLHPPHTATPTTHSHTPHTQPHTPWFQFQSPKVNNDM